QAVTQRPVLWLARPRVEAPDVAGLDILRQLVAPVGRGRQERGRLPGRRPPGGVVGGELAVGAGVGPQPVFDALQARPADHRRAADNDFFALLVLLRAVFEVGG